MNRHMFERKWSNIEDIIGLFYNQIDENYNRIWKILKSLCDRDVPALLPCCDIVLTLVHRRRVIKAAEFAMSVLKIIHALTLICVLSLLITALLIRLSMFVEKVVQITFQKGNFHCVTKLPFSETVEIIPKVNHSGKIPVRISDWPLNLHLISRMSGLLSAFPLCLHSLNPGTTLPFYCNREYQR